MYIIFGCIFGFCYFLSELEGPGMGNVLFRINSDGITEFSYESLINILIAPFKYKYFWTTLDLLTINWIITTLIGGLGGYIISYI